MHIFGWQHTFPWNIWIAMPLCVLLVVRIMPFCRTVLKSKLISSCVFTTNCSAAKKQAISHQLRESNQDILKLDGSVQWCLFEFSSVTDACQMSCSIALLQHHYWKFISLAVICCWPTGKITTSRICSNSLRNFNQLFSVPYSTNSPNFLNICLQLYHLPCIYTQTDRQMQVDMQKR